MDEVLYRTARISERHIRPQALREAPQEKWPRRKHVAVVISEQVPAEQHQLLYNFFQDRGVEHCYFMNGRSSMWQRNRSVKQHWIPHKALKIGASPNYTIHSLPLNLAVNYTWIISVSWCNKKKTIILFGHEAGGISWISRFGG